MVVSALQLAKKVSGLDIDDIAKNWIDNEIPVFGFVGEHCHWVFVGYIEDENKFIFRYSNIRPGSDSRKFALWNGIVI
jgi:hypothetical protein